MRLPRFRLKLWMLAVAIALMAVGTGAERTVRRVRQARERAAYHAREESVCRAALRDNKDSVRVCEVDLAEHRRNLAEGRGHRQIEENIAWELEATISEVRPSIDYFQRMLDHHSRMRQKYKRACRFPWPSVSPDPPEPDIPIVRSKSPQPLGFPPFLTRALRAAKQRKAP